MNRVTECWILTEAALKDYPATRLADELNRHPQCAVRRLSSEWLGNSTRSHLRDHTKQIHEAYRDLHEASHLSHAIPMSVDEGEAAGAFSGEFDPDAWPSDIPDRSDYGRVYPHAHGAPPVSSSSSLANSAKSPSRSLSAAFEFDTGRSCDRLGLIDRPPRASDTPAACSASRS